MDQTREQVQDQERDLRRIPAAGVTQGRVELLDHKQQAAEFRQLERRPGRGGGKDLVDHPARAGIHYDAANACALAAVAASIHRPGLVVFSLQSPGERPKPAFEGGHLIREWWK
jgi:hypothetical protein